MHSGATPRPRVRVWCRAVGLRVFVYFVRIHTRPTVPRGRSAEVLGDDGEGPEILFSSEEKRSGKGIKHVEGQKVVFTAVGCR